MFQTNTAAFMLSQSQERRSESLIWSQTKWWIYLKYVVKLPCEFNTHPQWTFLRTHHMLHQTKYVYGPKYMVDLTLLVSQRLPLQQVKGHVWVFSNVPRCQVCSVNLQLNYKNRYTELQNSANYMGALARFTSLTNYNTDQWGHCDDILSVSAKNINLFGGKKIFCLWFLKTLPQSS